MLLFPSGWLTPQKDGLYAQPHEDFLEVYRNAAMITAFFQPTPLGKGIAGGMSSLLGTLLFIDDTLDGSHVNNVRRVYDFANSITSDGSPSEDDVINDSIFAIDVSDIDSNNISFDAWYGEPKHGIGVRCHATLRGNQCDLEMGHTGPHVAYTNTGKLQWRYGDDYNSRTRY